VTQFQDLRWRSREVRVEYAWVGPESARGPLIVFLHEGLGSLAMWKHFPDRLCTTAGARGLVFSRPGYGQSTPRPHDEVWDVDFMHQQAYEVLPRLLDAVGVQQPVWLFGHSDGGSIALLHAGRHPERVAGLVLLAPHIFVEDITVRNIERAKADYETGGLRAGLAKYHGDPDSAFWGWNRIWLHPPFRRWNITDELADIRCPVLAIQGLDDAYGTLAQIRGIAESVPTTQLLEIPHCGHSPHRDQPEQVITATHTFIHHRRQA
jgi:pimeloyl-ACP methyl ester carboxylesterase